METWSEKHEIRGAGAIKRAGLAVEKFWPEKHEIGKVGAIKRAGLALEEF